MDKEELLKTVRERWQVMRESDDDNRREAMLDHRFINVPGEQWDEVAKRERGERPCYEFNKLRITAKRIINDMRANTPQGKVRGVEGADKDVAEIYEGLIRNIWNNSDGDTVVDYASEYQVSAGMGAWRISTDYISDDVFEQDIKLEAIPNPFCLYSDPASKSMLKEDARDWILTERISKEAFERRWPKAEPVSFDDNEFDDDDDWYGEDEVRIAEYWYKEPVKKLLIQLQDGKVVDGESDEAQLLNPEVIKNQREVMCDKIMMCIVSGDSILEGPVEWAGKYFPFIQIYGEYIVVDGKLQWHGIGRFAKDAQRSYNVSRTAITETIAMAPQAKWWATPEQAEGHFETWAVAHKENMPFMLFNADPSQPGAPQRMGGADVPVALIQESQIASEEIKAVTGIYDASLGNKSNENSGRAIYARQQQGEIATFNYSDNRAKGIKRTWDILIDLIPKVYDTERELRILGSDGADDYKRVNQFVIDQFGNPVKINDLSMGRYDATVTVGPSFSTRRQEAAEIYQQLMGGNPEIFGVAGDLIFKSMDLPYAEDIAERLQAMLPPPIQEMINNEQPMPPEVQQAMEQVRQAMSMVEEQAAMVQKAAQDADMAKSEAEKVIQQVEVEKAQFDAHVAKQMAGLEKRNAKITLDGVELEAKSQLANGMSQVEQERMTMEQMVGAQMQAAVQGIQELAARFNEFAVGTVEEIKKEKDERPKIKEVVAVREDGQLKAVPVYE